MKKLKLLSFLLVPVITASGLLAVASVASAQTTNYNTGYMMRYNRAGTATSTRYKMMSGRKRPKTPLISGNGQPIVGGTVAIVSGNTLSVTNASNVTYTVDASSATIVKANATSSVSNIAVGDRVVVQGAVNGTSITASSVVDQGVAKNPTGSNQSGNRRGFMGSIRGFLHNMFGFF
jgi:hypothetical protein